jgi:hypothetical protein
MPHLFRARRNRLDDIRAAAAFARRAAPANRSMHRKWNSENSDDQFVDRADGVVGLHDEDVPEAHRADALPGVPINETTVSSHRETDLDGKPSKTLAITDLVPNA